MVLGGLTSGGPKRPRHWQEKKPSGDAGEWQKRQTCALLWWGGFGIENILTINRFNYFHFILPFIILMIVTILLFLHRTLVLLTIFREQIKVWIKFVTVLCSRERMFWGLNIAEFGQYLLFNLCNYTFLCPRFSLN